MYSPSLPLPPIGGIWDRMTICVTAVCIPTLQINRGKGLEQALNSAEARSGANLPTRFGPRQLKPGV